MTTIQNNRNDIEPLRFKIGDFLDLGGQFGPAQIIKINKHTLILKSVDEIISRNCYDMDDNIVDTIEYKKYSNIYVNLHTEYDNHYISRRRTAFNNKGKVVRKYIKVFPKKE